MDFSHLTDRTETLNQDVSLILWDFVKMPVLTGSVGTVLSAAEWDFLAAFEHFSLLPVSLCNCQQSDYN